MPVNNSISKLKDFLLNLFFPRFCLGCQKEGAYLCDDCRTLLDIAEFNYCLCNTKPLRLPAGQKIGKCQRCHGPEGTPKLSGLYFALPYKEKQLTRKLIHQFKYRPYLKDLSKTLANILIEHFIISGKNTDDIWDNSVLIPVPLDRKKLKERGYNQSEELAKELSKILQIPVISDILIKIKITKPQMELSKEQRGKNLEGAFAISHCGKGNSPTKQFIVGKKIFLVDDVYTTGSTMEECAKTLKEAGVKSVWGIAIAREG